MVLRDYSALRSGSLCPRRQSNQNAAETSLVSDFQLLPGGSCVASEGEKGISRCFSLLRIICRRSLPDGPRTDGLRNLFAKAADNVRRITQAVICSFVSGSGKVPSPSRFACHLPQRGRQEKMQSLALALPLGELSNEVRLRGHFAQIFCFQQAFYGLQITTAVMRPTSLAASAKSLGV